MNRKFSLLILLNSILCLVSCSTSSSTTSTITSSTTKIEPSVTTNTSAVSSSEITSKEIVFTPFMYFPDQVLEVGQKLYIFNYLSEFENLSGYVEDTSICELNFKKFTLEAKKEGVTNLIIEKEGAYQKVKIEVKKENSLASNWTFEQLIESKQRKNFVVIGDSVSADETYFNKDKTYASLVSNLVGGKLINNYAIGGTTATYMYKGSNIEKEYGNNTVAIDGVRVTKKAYDNNELADVDFAFIAFGHNDQYFQPPIDEKKDFNIANFDSAHSFKGSYRYMINLLRLANPNVKIILLNCTYSEYAVRSSAWEYKLTYEDYRHAITEVAKEMDCKLIDPWNYMKKFFDGKTTKAYYHDDVHLSQLGHQKLRDYVMKH